jgi:polar amino acid transport system permease protein
MDGGMSEVWDSRHLIWLGLKLTLQLSAVAIVASTIIGLFVGVGLVYGNRVVRALLRLYVDIIRGLPILVVLFIIYYILPAVDINVLGWHVPTNVGRFEAAALGLSLFGAAQVGEVVRGALASVPQGQIDAGKSLGLTFWQRLFSISLPQSLPVIIPPWTNTAAELVKGTSLASLLAMSELLFATRKIVERTGDVLPFYLAAAGIYFVICFGISRAGALIAQRYRFGVAR